MLRLEVGKTYLDATGHEITITGFDPFLKAYFSEIIESALRGTISTFRYYSRTGEAIEPRYHDLLAEKPGQEVPAPSAPTLCPVQHRIRTAQEVGLDEPTLVAYGGKFATTIKAAPYAHDRTVYAVVGNEVVALVPEWIETTTIHSFADTGMQKSWCKCCNAEGRFDWRAGRYI